jgi:hypothetical protein
MRGELRIRKEAIMVNLNYTTVRLDTRLQTGRPEFDPRQRERIFLPASLSRSTIRPT